MEPSGDLGSGSTLSILEEIYQRRPPPSPQRSAPVRRVLRLPSDRLVATLAVVVGVVAMFIGAAQLRANVHFPTSVLPVIDAPSLLDLSSRAALGFSVPTPNDTDGDGLLDSEEAQHKSSVYLEDTDSDGRTDGEEVRAGTDPTCPTGQTCGVGLSTPAAAPSPPASILPGIPQSVPEPPPGLPAVPSSGAAFDPQKIREQLVGAGISAELLSGFSDEQLQSVYQEAVVEQSSGSGSAADDPSALAIPPTDLPAGAGSAKAGLPSVAEVRVLLLEQGLPQATLDRLSDAQLEALMRQVISAGPPAP